MKKRLVSLLAVLVLVFSMAMPAYAVFADETTLSLGATATASDDSRVIDNAAVLTDEQKSQLEAQFKEIRERQKIDIGVLTVNSLEGKEVVAYADDYYDNNGFGIGKKRSGCLLLIAMDSRDWYISTRGKCIKALTDEGIQNIGSNMMLDMKGGNWYGAFTTYASNVDKALSNNKKASIKGVFISLVVAAVIALIIVKKIKTDYTKAVRFSPNASNYLVPGSLQVTAAFDNFLYSNVTKTKIESDSGGSSTHRSSSGATHGGGGGKF